jgi:inorganic pyrophosphatase
MDFSGVGIGPESPRIVNTVIEIPKGGSNKYEVDEVTGLVKLDRVLYSPLFYPCDYGYIPGTLYSDGDPLDVLVLLSHPTFPGCIVEARPIGVLGMSDDKGQDDKILCVALKDPRFAGINSIDELGTHTKKEIMHFFEVYKQLEEKQVSVIGWGDELKALELIDAYRRTD